MGEGDLATLCRSCGLCCDGSLFGRARLDADEVDVARKQRLRVVANGGSFEQRCVALLDRACTIYDDRPRACRSFVCRLYERHRQEGGPLEARLARVRRARELLDHLACSPCGADVPAELTTLLEEDFARARV